MRLRTDTPYVKVGTILGNLEKVTSDVREQVKDGTEEEAGEGQMGVWDPTGVEPRPGSGLPVEEGREEVRVLARSLPTGGSLQEVPLGKLEGLLRGPETVIWVDVLRPHEGGEPRLRAV
jgi:hypothetical protein